MALTGPEIMDEMVQDVSLDPFFRKPYRTMTRADFIRVIEIERADRARYKVAQADRKAKKQGALVEEPSE